VTSSALTASAIRATTISRPISSSALDAGRGEKTAFIDGNGQYSYADLAGVSNASPTCCARSASAARSAS